MQQGTSLSLLWFNHHFLHGKQSFKTDWKGLIRRKKKKARNILLAVNGTASIPD
jgi:hypothetical protein